MSKRPMIQNRIPSVTVDEMFAVVAFFLPRKGFGWNELCNKAGLSPRDTSRAIVSGEYEVDWGLQTVIQMCGALNIDYMEDVVCFKRKYSKSTNLFCQRYYVEFLVRVFIIKRQPPPLHRLPLISHCVSLVGEPAKSTMEKAARDRPPRKVMDVAHVYKQMIRRGDFNTFGT